MSRSVSRPAQSPHRLALLGGIWLAVVGEWPLWQALAHLPALGEGRTPAFLGSAMVLLAALYALALSALAWPRLVRPALSVALLGTAWCALDGGHRPLGMPGPTLAFGLAGAPLLWLWSRPVAPTPDTWAQLLHNLGLAMAATGVAAAVLILSVADFSWMWLQHAALVELLQPVKLWRGCQRLLEGSPVHKVLFLQTSQLGWAMWPRSSRRFD